MVTHINIKKHVFIYFKMKNVIFNYSYLYLKIEKIQNNDYVLNFKFTIILIFWISNAMLIINNKYFKCILYVFSAYISLYYH